MSRFLLILLAGLAVSAAPPPDEAVRAGVRAFAAGDLQAADDWFRRAAERTPDPGRVAFARAAVAARRNDWRAAEVGFLQALDDADCPPRRRAEATYNRGVCLLHRGGPAAVFRTAVDLFARAAEQLGDDPLGADARHNLELAKLLWAEARQREKTPPNPGDDPPPLPELPPPPAAGDAPGEPAAGPERSAERPGTAARTGPGPGTGETAGAGPLPVLNDTDAPQPLSPADTRARLLRANDRLVKERKANARLLAGPERPDVRDW